MGVAPGGGAGWMTLVCAAAISGRAMSKEHEKTFLSFILFSWVEFQGQEENAIENWPFANARSAVECGTRVPLWRYMTQSGAIAPHSKAACQPPAFRWI
jgi:hypothetical protein